MTGLGTDASLPSPGIIGPWATIGAGTSSAYATTNSGNIVAYAGLATPFNWSTTIPNNTNMEVAATSAAIGIDRMCNTLRWTGGAASETYGSGTSANRLILNGLLNSGTGTLTLIRGSGAPRLAIGTNSHNELVLNAANAGITISSLFITNSSTAAGSILILGTGANTVTFSGTANAYTGGTTINSGVLALSGVGTTLGAATNPLTVNGGVLNLGGLTTPAAGAVTISGGAIQNGPLTGTSYTANNPGAATVSAALAGASAALPKSGNGTLTLS